MRRDAHRPHAAVPRDVWNEAFAADPLAMPFQAPSWVDVMTGDGRYEDVSRLYDLGDGRMGVLPMVCSANPDRAAGAGVLSHSTGKPAG